MQPITGGEPGGASGCTRHNTATHTAGSSPMVSVSPAAPGWAGKLELVQRHGVASAAGPPRRAGPTTATA